MLKWIDDFLALAKYKQFSLAAESIFISQSALSKHIKALESELGKVLFLRSSTKATLTEAGKLYLNYALTVRKLTNDLRYTLEKSGISQDIIHLSIGSIPCIVESGTMQWLLGFQEIHQSFSLELSESDQCRLLNQLASKELDVAICRLDFLSTVEYVVVPIVTDEMVLICNKEMYPFEAGNEVDLGALPLEPVYTIAKESDVYKLARKQLNVAGINAGFAGTFPRHMMIFPLLCQKRGWALLPMQIANLNQYPQLTHYRIRDAVTTQIGLVKLASNGFERNVHDKTEVLFDYFKRKNKAQGLR